MKKSFLLLMLLGCGHQVLRVEASKSTIVANGYDHMVFRISDSSRKPQVEFVGDRLFCHVGSRRLADGNWEAELDAGVMPGSVKVRISSGGRHVNEAVTLLPETADSGSDGTPDFLRLEDESDRAAFRGWMTYLAELQYFISPNARPQEIIDCSSLVRFCYREALREHDAAWIAGVKLPIVFADSSIKKYSFPHTSLGPDIFRTRGGSYSPQDGAFAEFADAKTLREFNTFFVSRDVSRAQPGDILFYRRDTVKGPSYHSMIFIGPSKVKHDAEIYVVYHTGPDGSNDGEIRRLTLTQLLHFPNPQWQPIAANEHFLGVYRWNILKVIS
jgi:uncharacterized protein YfaT (DUF1175 family)